jgi:hypothetical protein
MRSSAWAPTGWGRQDRQEAPGDHRAHAEEGEHPPSADAIALEQEHAGRHEHGQQHLRDEQIPEDRGVADGGGDVPAEPEPDEALRELVGGEDQRQCADQELVGMPDAAQRGDGDRHECGGDGEIGFRREAHARTRALSGVCAAP